MSQVLGRYGIDKDQDQDQSNKSTFFNVVIAILVVIACGTGLYFISISKGNPLAELFKGTPLEQPIDKNQNFEIKTQLEEARLPQLEVQKSESLKGGSISELSVDHKVSKQMNKPRQTNKNNRNIKANGKSRPKINVLSSRSRSTTESSSSYYRK